MPCQIKGISILWTWYPWLLLSIVCGWLHVLKYLAAMCITGLMVQHWEGQTFLPTWTQWCRKDNNHQLSHWHNPYHCWWWYITSHSDQISILFLHNLLMLLETPCYKIPFAPRTSSCFQSFWILPCHATYNFDRELPSFLVFCSKCHETCFEYVAGLVYGESIRSTAGIAKIRKNLGVCPQVLNEFHLSVVECS